MVDKWAKQRERHPNSTALHELCRHGITCVAAHQCSGENDHLFAYEGHLGPLLDRPLHGAQNWLCCE